jgi:AcrR family transcriptional regulator
MSRSKNSYHHGDLRRALLDAALLEIEETGLEGLSLRKLAARVGVSHAAPEHHFPNIRSLHNAMAKEGFDLFTQAMVQERGKSAADPIEQMRAAMRGYLAYASAHPALFRLMFNAGMLDWSDEALQQSAGSGHRQLVEICAPAADALGYTTEAERASLEMMVWSQIHGQAHLMIDQKFPTVGPDCPPTAAHVDFTEMLFRSRKPD